MRSPLKANISHKKQAARREKQIAQYTGGNTVPNSGATDGAKGDISTDNFLIDSKETGAKSIIVSAKQLNKISREAREVNKRPALVLTLGKVNLGTSRQWALIPLSDFKEMTNDNS